MESCSFKHPARKHCQASCSLSFNAPTAPLLFSSCSDFVPQYQKLDLFSLSLFPEGGCFWPFVFVGVLSPKICVISFKAFVSIRAVRILSYLIIVPLISCGKQHILPAHMHCAGWSPLAGEWKLESRCRLSKHIHAHPGTHTLLHTHIALRSSAVAVVPTSIPLMLSSWGRGKGGKNKWSTFKWKMYRRQANRAKTGRKLFITSVIHACCL